MSDQRIIILRNPARFTVPLVTAIVLLLMFLPPLIVNIASAGDASRDPTKAIIGAVILLLSVAGFAYSAWKAPVEARIGESITLRRAFRAREYPLTRIRKWFFAVPNGTPTQKSPNTNALLHLVMDDRTYFRGEVSAEDAVDVAHRLPQANA